jgi:hypothetical protein
MFLKFINYYFIKVANFLDPLPTYLLAIPATMVIIIPEKIEKSIPFTPFQTTLWLFIIAIEHGPFIDDTHDLRNLNPINKW